MISTNVYVLTVMAKGDILAQSKETGFSFVFSKSQLDVWIEEYAKGLDSDSEAIGGTR